MNIFFEHSLREKLNKLLIKVNDNISKGNSSWLSSIKLKLENIIKDYPDEGLAYFLLGKILNYFNDYYNAYKNVNNAIDKGYLEGDYLRKELLEKIIKFKNIDNYCLEQELYKTIQIFSKEQSLYKVSFKKEDLQRIESFYERIKKFSNDISNYEQKDKFLKPCELLLDKITSLLEKSVILNIIYEGLQDKINYISFLNKNYHDINKDKIYYIITLQIIIFENILSDLNISKNTDLSNKFYELSNIINSNYHYKENLLDVFFNYNEYNDFDEEREPKIFKLHKLEINIRDNSKLIGLLLKSINIYSKPFHDNIPDIVDYVDELEYLISYMKKNTEISINFVIKLELIISLYLAWFLVLYEIKNNVNYFANQILQKKIEKLKLCL
jgi:hypothetical protein